MERLGLPFTSCTCSYNTSPPTTLQKKNKRTITSLPGFLSQQDGHLTKFISDDIFNHTVNLPTRNTKTHDLYVALQGMGTPFFYHTPIVRTTSFDPKKVTQINNELTASSLPMLLDILGNTHPSPPVFNLLSLNSDLSQISHCSNKGLSVREVRRIDNMITQVKFS